MAVRYAVASGNWSNTATWDGGTLPTSNDDVYSNTYTVTIDQNVTVLTIRNTSNTSPAIAAGGGFLINTGGYTIECTANIGLVVGANTLLSITQPSGTTTINASVIGTNTANITSINITGNGTVNFLKRISINNNSNQNRTVAINPTSGSLIVNITANINDGSLVAPSGSTQSGAIGLVGGISTINVIGNVIGSIGTFCNGVWCSGGVHTLNITGNVTGRTYEAVRVTGGSLTVNQTGNLTWDNPGASTGSGACYHRTAGTLNVSIIGTLINPMINTYNNPLISSTNYLKIIGTITQGQLSTSPCITTQLGPTILTGPLISNELGFVPILTTRVYLKPTMGTYFQFQDDSTNGSTSPTLPNPTLLVSPDTVSDAPIPANVRQGIVYALGSQTGTLIVPNPANVALGIPTDNTVGTAVLTPQNLFDAILNDADPIAERLRNVATVQTTGDQIAAI